MTPVRQLKKSSVAQHETIAQVKARNKLYPATFVEKYILCTWNERYKCKRSENKFGNAF